MQDTEPLEDTGLEIITRPLRCSSIQSQECLTSKCSGFLWLELIFVASTMTPLLNSAFDGIRLARSIHSLEITTTMALVRRNPGLLMHPLLLT